MRRTRVMWKAVFAILAVLCLLGALSASLWSGTEHHDGSSESCVICFGISLREHLTDLMLGCVGLMLLGLVPCTIPLLSVHAAERGERTPVRLKVKLLN